jgi:hypothetical protein
MRLTLLVAGALTVVAFAALPAVASAGTPETHCNDGKATCGFTVTGGEFKLSTNKPFTVICTSLSGSGVMGTTGGSVQLTLHGCVDGMFKSECHGTGQPEGTISTTVLPYDNTYVTDNKLNPGALVTPNSGHFVTFSCFGGTGKSIIGGNGVMGRFTKPACGGSTTDFTWTFEVKGHGVQTYMKVTETGEAFDLNDGTATAAVVGDFTAKVPSPGATLTCV